MTIQNAIQHRVLRRAWVVCDSEHKLLSKPMEKYTRLPSLIPLVKCENWQSLSDQAKRPEPAPPIVKCFFERKASPQKQMQWSLPLPNIFGLRFCGGSHEISVGTAYTFVNSGTAPSPSPHARRGRFSMYECCSQFGEHGS